MKYFVYIVIAVVAAAIVAGFLLVGSPSEERARRFDDQRVSDLQFLQNEIVNYWQGKAKLPKKLTDIKDSIRGITLPKDPQTGIDYVYEIKDQLSFNLCANFNLPSTQDQIQKLMPAPQLYPYLQGNWQHIAGKVCFERKIDKDIYKPIIPPPTR